MKRININMTTPMTTTSTSTEAKGGAERPDLAKRVNRIILLAAAALLLNAIYDYSSKPAQAKLLDVGDHMPDYSLSLLDGSEANGQALLGKPALYYFYANWCPCSHESVVSIRRAAEKGKAAGLSVVFVGIQDSAENLERFAKIHKLEFPVVTQDGQNLAGRVGISITPTTVFVDKDGVVRSLFVGKVERFEQLADGLKSIMPATGLAQGVGARTADVDS